MSNKANERVGPIEGSIGAEADSLRRKLAAAEARCSELEAEVTWQKAAAEGAKRERDDLRAELEGRLREAEQERAKAIERIGNPGGKSWWDAVQALIDVKRILGALAPGETADNG